MEITEKSVEMILCQKEKDAVAKSKKDFLNFVVKSLDSESISKASEALLPFDNFVSAKQCFVNESSLVRSMGFSLMRMELEPSTFSLGISIEICGGTYNNKTNSTLFITAFKTMTQLSEYVKSDGFSSTVTEYFESEIDKSFFPSKQELNKEYGT